MPKRVEPLNAKALEKWKPLDALDELIDGAVPGLRVRKTAQGLSWALSVRFAAKRKRFAVGMGLTLAEARRAASSMRLEVAEGRDPTAARKERRERQKDAAGGLGTVRSVIDLYFEHRSELRSSQTQRRALTAVFRAYLDQPALDFTPAMAQLAADDYAKDRSRALARAAVTYLRPLMKWAGKRGLSQRGFGELEQPGASERRQLVLSVSEVGALLRSLESAPRDAAVRMMLLTGARLGEVCGLTWGELDLKALTWTIPGARRKNVKPTKTLADHVLPLPRQLAAMLRDSSPGAADARVFIDPKGRPLSVASNWPKWSRKKRAALGFHVTPHALRRTFATMLGEAGAPPHVVEAALGHALDDAVAAAYNKASYVNEAAEHIQRHADRLEAIQSGLNVIALKRRA
jgi:integrase